MKNKTSKNIWFGILAAVVLLVNAGCDSPPEKISSPTEIGTEEDTTGRYYHNKGLIFYRKGENDSALHYFLKAIPLLKRGQDTKMLLKAYSNIGLPLYSMGREMEMLAYNDSAVVLLQKTDPGLQERASVFLNRAHIQTLLGKREKTREVYFQLLEELEDTTLYDTKATIYMNLAKTYANEHYLDSANLDTAARMGQNALQNALLSKEARVIARAKLFYGTTLVFRNTDIEGMSYLREALEWYSQNEDSYNRVYTLLQMAKCYLLIGELGLATAMADSAITLAHRENFPVHLIGAMDAKYRAFRKGGDYTSALLTHEKMVYIQDSLDQVNLKEEIAELEVRYQTRKKDYALQLLRAEGELARKERQQLYIISGGLTFLLITGVFFASYRFRIKNRLARQREIQYTTELRNQQLEQEKLRTEIEAKSRQLFTQALHLSERNELLEELLREIRESQDKTTPDILARLQSTLRQNLTSEIPWEDFRKTFEEVHPSFFEALKTLQTDLTEKETRLLAFAKIGMSIKEIAHILHIAPASVKMARYRLKKKFGLDGEDSLEDFVDRL